MCKDRTSSNSLVKDILLILCIMFLPFDSSSFAMHDDFDCEACHKSLSVDKHNAKHTRGMRINDMDVNLFCISCHDRNRDISRSNTPYVMNNDGQEAGGDFVYSAANHNMGHNIFSVDYVNGNVPPGGVGQASFTCLSCHSSHTNGNYRNLKKQINGVPTLVYGIPDPNYYDNVYISGMSNFCGACHNQFHGLHNTKRGGSWTRHPVDITISSAEHAGFREWSELEGPITKVENPDGNVLNKYNAKVFCLSCHFSHASEFDNALRWDNKTSSSGCYECHDISSLE